MRTAFEATGPDLETGGALFGAGELDAVKIMMALGPGPNAVRERTFFLRDLNYTQAAAERLFRADGSQWIGEWHSHPNAPPTPSERDIETYARHLADPELQFTYFVALIVSPTANGVTVTAWVLITPEAGLELHAAMLSVEDDEEAAFPSALAAWLGLRDPAFGTQSGAAHSLRSVGTARAADRHHADSR